jgi:acyl-coenzyme A synthetase/AMP-(fatty) acid ligase
MELIIAYLATVIAGKILLLADPKYKDELENIINEYEVTIVIGDSDLELKMKNLTASINEPNSDRTFINISTVADREEFGLLDEEHNLHKIPDTDSKSPSVIIFSSGSEGIPKGIMNSQYTLMEACKNYVRTCNITKNDRFLGVTPFFHSYCMGSCMLAGVYSGAYIYTMKSFVPGKILKAIENYKITIFQGVSFMYELLIKNNSASNLSLLRLCISAGGRLTKDLIDRIHAETGVWIINEYGSSETGTIAINYPSINHYITGNILKGVDIKLIEIDDKGVGRLRVKSKGLSLGYWKKERKDEEYYTTDDLVEIVGNNKINICGRCNNMVSISGMKVDIKEVEKLILEHPKVQDCLVKKREDAIYGECIEAVIVSKDKELTESNVREFCAEHLAKYKVPSYITFVHEIRTSALGKKLYRQKEIANG